MSGIETAEAPEWLSQLESRREKRSRGRLGHDSGLGAPCNVCGPSCPGLELHFWRRVCKECRCSQDSHDVRDDDASKGWAQFELLGSKRPLNANASMKIRALADEPVHLEWVPPDASPDVVSDYMATLGRELAPVAGSEGAAKRREQLRRQVPLHDVRSDLCCHTKPQERDSHEEYISQIKNNIVGMGNIVRIGTVQKGNMLTVANEASRPVTGVKSFSLPLKVSTDGVQYASVPKSATDKALHLDKMGNVISKSAHLVDFEVSPSLSAAIRNKLRSMAIESDRIKSAVEHGPVYDKLFMDLRRLNVPVHADVYLRPIMHFRSEYNNNPRFRDETLAFAESMGAKPIPALSNSANNNDGSPLKGTIYGPEGEIWSWKTSRANDEDMPPPVPNYNTHPMRDSNRLNYEDAKQPSAKALDGLAEDVNKLELENTKSNKCSRCKHPVKVGDVAVKAEKAGDDHVWHPLCFTCVKCNQLLADLVYFYHKGEIYCGRDLAEVLKRMRCAACDELIFSNLYTKAEGQIYHTNHFCCYHCDIPLGDKRYVPDDKTGQHSCLDCYEKLEADTCHACKRSIAAHEAGVAWPPFHWHTSCFLCANQACNKSLLQGRFVVKEEMPFCSSVCVKMVIK